MTSQEPFVTPISDSESETISITTSSRPESPARTASFLVNPALEPEDDVFAPALNSSGLLPAYRFADDIEEDYFCKHSANDGSPLVLGLGIVGLPAYGSGSTVECSATTEISTRIARSRQRGKLLKTTHPLLPELDYFPSPPGCSFEWESSGGLSVEEMPGPGSPESTWDFADDQDVLLASLGDGGRFVEINITITGPESTPKISSLKESIIKTRLSVENPRERGVRQMLLWVASGKVLDCVHCSHPVLLERTYKTNLHFHTSLIPHLTIPQTDFDSGFLKRTYL